MEIENTYKLPHPGSLIKEAMNKMNSLPTPDEIGVMIEDKIAELLPTVIIPLVENEVSTRVPQYQTVDMEVVYEDESTETFKLMYING